jgi:hypothetical protein
MGAMIPIPRREVDRMDVYCFELHFAAPPGEQVIDALYEAGWGLRSAASAGTW